ncbi:MAG: methyltransferase [Gammaproteobacteria bacterium]|nr:methyltransferase [Gammaproteobacteria bacterium]
MKRIAVLLMTFLFATQAQAWEHTERLAKIMAAQDEAVQARFAVRNPLRTMAFFGIEPGMTVIEGLPGDAGWYTGLLVPFLGADGALVGADYAERMFPWFGFFSDEFIASKATWVEDWTAATRERAGEVSTEISAFQFGSMPEDMEGKADAALMIRAFHNLFRFEAEHGVLSEALDEIYRALKPGGVLGVIQHQAPDHMPAGWANGSRGYVKKATMIERLQAAGFVFEAESAVNQNPKDQPGPDDFVWRLPPSLATSGEDPALRARMLEVGESNRMTLRFRKPEQASEE